MKTFSHPPTVAVCTREREGWVGDGPKGSYLSNFRRLQKEQPRAAAAPPPEREGGIGRGGAILRFVPKIWYRKSSRSELECVSFHYLGNIVDSSGFGRIEVGERAKKMRRHR